GRGWRSAPTAGAQTARKGAGRRRWRIVEPEENSSDPSQRVGATSPREQVRSGEYPEGVDIGGDVGCLSMGVAGDEIQQQRPALAEPHSCPAAEREVIVQLQVLMEHPDADRGGDHDGTLFDRL